MWRLWPWYLVGCLSRALEVFVRHFKKKRPSILRWETKRNLKTTPRSCESKRRPKKRFQGSLFLTSKYEKVHSEGWPWYMWWMYVSMVILSALPAYLTSRATNLICCTVVNGRGPSSYLRFKDQCERQSFIYLIWNFGRRLPFGFGLFHCCGWIHLSWLVTKDGIFVKTPVDVHGRPVHPWSHGSLQIWRW